MSGKKITVVKSIYMTILLTKTTISKLYKHSWLNIIKPTLYEKSK